MPEELAGWFQYDRPPTFEASKRFVRVPMRDGVHLGCDIYRPAQNGGSAAGAFPGIVLQFAPYFVGNALGAYDGYADYYAARGYVGLACNPRGTGRSEGVWPGSFGFTPEGNQDNYDMIEWLAAQSYTTGMIGQEGVSYGGMTTYRVAAMRPPSLVTIVPQQSARSLYLDCAYPGGIRSGCDPSWQLIGGALSGGRAVPVQQALDWLQHPLLDDYWKQMLSGEMIDRIEVPVLGFGGQSDIFHDAMVRNYIGLKSRTWFVDGPWTHDAIFDETVTRGTTLAWFDYWLRGDASAPLPPARVMSYEMGSGDWHLYEDWPPPRTTGVRLHLNTEGDLDESVGEGGSASYVANPAGGTADGPQDGEHLEFTSAPLTKDLVITGAGRVQLEATLTDPAGMLDADGRYQGHSVDTNFVFELLDVAPDDTAARVTLGYLKASHLRSHTYPTQIELEEPTEYEIALWHINWRIPEGHRLRLRLDSAAKEMDDPGVEPSADSQTAIYQPIPPLTVTVATGIGGSLLELPVKDACRAAPAVDRGDIPSVHIANVDCAYQEHIAEGFVEDGRNLYRPAQPTRRDQMASFVARTMEAAGYELPQPRDQGFGDIEGNMHADAINQLAEVRVVRGRDAHTFDPAAQIRRDEMAAFLARASRVMTGEDLEPGGGRRFTDSGESFHRDDIEAAAAANLVQGRTPRTFDTASSTRRDQMASFLIRLLAAGPPRD